MSEKKIKAIVAPIWHTNKTETSPLARARIAKNVAKAIEPTPDTAVNIVRPSFPSLKTSSEKPGRKSR
jgi:hypothetical protein